MVISNKKLQVVNELHKPCRRNFRRRRTIIKGFGDLWQIDLAEMQPYASENKGYRYIFIVIDCYSKYLWTRPLKNKTGIEITKAMRSILRESKYSPKNLQSDQGTEFYNKNFSALMKQHVINHYSTCTTKKAAIAERVIRTLKNWLYKKFSARGKYKWDDILFSATKTYNNKVHRTIGMKPSDVKPTTRLHVYNHINIALKPKFCVGDIVRISKHKGIFEKGFTPNFSTELFKVVKRCVTNPTTYLLEDMYGQPIKGCFYEMELQKTKYPDVYLVEKVLKKKGKKIFVKWLGFSNEHNSWIDKTDVV